MFKEKLMKDLFNKIPNKADVVIFGACEAAQKIASDIKIYKPKVKIKGFIDNNVSGDFMNLPVWNLKQFLNLSDIKYDLVILSTRTNELYLINLFNIFKIPIIPQTQFLYRYYRNKYPFFNEENYEKIINMFHRKNDKKLFDLLFKARARVCPLEVLKEYYNKNVADKFLTFNNFEKHYLEYINKDIIETVIDSGFHDGLNAFIFCKKMKNIKKIYGFEAIYDVVQKPWVEQLFDKDIIEIVPFALADCDKTIDFNIDYSCLGASYAHNISSRSKSLENKIKNVQTRKVKVTTIDKFINKNNIKPDLIKMDIEGAELPALNGAIETIIKYRPQLAVSIYHTDYDFINIPLFLKDNLKDYNYYINHYSPCGAETVIYAIPKEKDIN